MNVLVKTKFLSLALSALGAAAFSGTAPAEEPPCPFHENRSGLCGYYHSEISPARAFADTVASRGKWGSPSKQPVIIDVRSTPEYKAGHPEHAYNVPYPYIYQYCDEAGRAPDGACAGGKVAEIAQDPAAFADYVESLVPDKSTPIYTLCRTGVRSVNAANVLTDRGYTNVRNIWEGFVGIYLTAPQKQADGTTKTVSVDINHDGVLNDGDKNGWRYHQALPYDTRLLPPLIYQPYAYLYDMAD
ncbi:sulfurtransferase [Sulfurifustis variabilis]|uniref:Sulfurtransferase n=1 Tax=Sulfurifustis variabilis TaxID=1675686 RepID=A0A1B4V756_9GAMM|nr:rhodanese-like domain-containing protein [Sulfurifustis variabilis]BAU49373.1 sulfurtransferase [Sulfurifustis variabilis]